MQHLFYTYVRTYTLEMSYEFGQASNQTLDNDDMKSKLPGTTYMNVRTYVCNQLLAPHSTFRYTLIVSATHSTFSYVPIDPLLHIQMFGTNSTLCPTLGLVPQAHPAFCYSCNCPDCLWQVQRKAVIQTWNEACSKVRTLGFPLVSVTVGRGPVGDA